MKQKLVHLLLEKELTISAAESCTGGLFTASIVDVPGSSSVLKESIITYSNEAKRKYLQVSSETLMRFGAVSEQCAVEMAEGIKKQANADIGVAITGIAGPDGGTLEKPVGLVYIGIACHEALVYKHQFEGTRSEIRKQAVQKTLKYVYELLGEI